MKKTPASLRSDAPAAISETGGRNGTKSLAELSEIPNGSVSLFISLSILLVIYRQYAHYSKPDQTNFGVLLLSYSHSCSNTPPTS